MSLKTWIKTVITAIEQFLGEVKDEAEVILTKADNFINEVKAFSTTATGEEIETAVETVATVIFPELNIPGIVSFIKKLFVDLNWATAEVDKPDNQILADGLTYLSNLSGNVKAVQLNTFTASVAAYVSDVAKAGLTIEQILTATQVVHNGIISPAVAEVPAAEETETETDTTSNGPAPVNKAAEEEGGLTSAAASDLPPTE